MFVAKYTKQLLSIAAAIILAAGAIIGIYGVPLGIDFTGGSLTEVSYDVQPEKSVLESELNNLELGGYSLRGTVGESGKDGYILRTRDLTDSERQSVHATLTREGDGGAIVRFTSIGPVIGEELRDKAIWAISAVVIMIVLYVAFAFRKVAGRVRSWVYGAITIFALLHDVLVPVAFVSLAGYFFGIEADVLFIMALLTILGYSVNDTIVVFDRVRENVLRNQEMKVEEPFADTVGRAVQETMGRSINTSLTTLIALLALYVLGGDVTKNFALTLMVGVVAGAYSSIFIANPLLILIEKYQKNKPVDVKE
jgi:preprotein translocase subunit SecF